MNPETGSSRMSSAKPRQTSSTSTNSQSTHTSCQPELVSSNNSGSLSRHGTISSEKRDQQLDEVSSEEKRRTMSDNDRLEKRRACNRRTAAASRKRRLELIEGLQTTCASLSAELKSLRSERDQLRHLISQVLCYQEHPCSKMDRSLLVPTDPRAVIVDRLRHPLQADLGQAYGNLQELRSGAGMRLNQRRIMAGRIATMNQVPITFDDDAMSLLHPTYNFAGHLVPHEDTNGLATLSENNTRLLLNYRTGRERITSLDNSHIDSDYLLYLLGRSYALQQSSAGDEIGNRALHLQGHQK